MAEFVQLPEDWEDAIHLLHWHKAEGDAVQEGDVLLELESDKATMEYTSEFEGVLLYIKVPKGLVRGGDILGIIGEEGENLSNILAEKEAGQQLDKAQEVDVVRLPEMNAWEEEARIAGWRVQEGDTIQRGDVLVEVETDKALVEIESYLEGTVLYRLPDEVSRVLKNQILVIVGPPGTVVSSILEKG